MGDGRSAPRETREERTRKLPRELTAERERRGMTQREAAAEVGVSVRTFVAWETGETLPRGVGVVAAVERFLGHGLDWKRLRGAAK